MHYHDTEWGKQTQDEKKLFEFLILESAQAGLSWITVLKRRENYKELYSQFNPERVANYTEEDAARLLQNPGIIRNRLKITSSITNAQVFLRIQKEFGSFYSYLYSFLPNQKPIVNAVKTSSDVPVTSEIAERLSKDLRTRGFKFWGPVICYAYMQAIGMVNDHETACSFK